MAKNEKNKPETKDQVPPTVPVPSAVPTTGSTPPPAPEPPAEQQPPAPAVTCKAGCGATLSADEVAAGYEVCETCGIAAEEAEASRVAAEKAAKEKADKEAAEEAAEEAEAARLAKEKAAAPANPDADEPPTAEDILDELRGADAILGENMREGITTVVTRGGVKLRLPGDEALALRLTQAQLFGTAPANPADDGSGQLQPKALRDLEEAGVVLSKAERVDEDGKRYVSVVTRGGDKLRFPGDEMKAARLTEERLTGVSAKESTRAIGKINLFGRKAK